MGSKSPHRALIPLLHPAPASHRHASTARRTTKLLRPPAPKHLRQTLVPGTDHITFNPPPTAPSPFHTPALFLPATDPRCALLAATRPSREAGPGRSAEGSRLPPPVRPQYEKTYHLSAEQIEEIRALRKSDPWKNTRAKLAKQFGCTEFFVGLVVKATPERLAWARKREEAVRERWGERRTAAREDRAKRRELWKRDD